MLPAISCRMEAISNAGILDAPISLTVQVVPHIMLVVNRAKYPFVLEDKGKCQCLKCLVPVMIMTKPFTLQYSMLSLSLTDPPG